MNSSDFTPEGAKELINIMENKFILLLQNISNFINERVYMSKESPMKNVKKEELILHEQKDNHYMMDKNNDQKVYGGTMKKDDPKEFGNTIRELLNLENKDPLLTEQLVEINHFKKPKIFSNEDQKKLHEMFDDLNECLNDMKVYYDLKNFNDGNIKNHSCELPKDKYKLVEQMFLTLMYYDSPMLQYAIECFQYVIYNDSDSTEEKVSFSQYKIINSSVPFFDYEKYVGMVLYVLEKYVTEISHKETEKKLEITNTMLDEYYLRYHFHKYKLSRSKLATATVKYNSGIIEAEVYFEYCAIAMIDLSDYAVATHYGKLIETEQNVVEELNDLYLKIDNVYQKRLKPKSEYTFKIMAESILNNVSNMIDYFLHVNIKRREALQLIDSENFSELNPEKIDKLEIIEEKVQISLDTIKHILNDPNKDFKNKSITQDKKEETYIKLQSLHQSLIELGLRYNIKDFKSDQGNGDIILDE